MFDWEGTIITVDKQKVHVHASYTVGWDSEGKTQVAYVNKVRAFDGDGRKVESDMDLIKAVEDAIDEEDNELDAA